MAMSYNEFVKAAQAEVVGSRIIVGRGGDRKFVGTIEGGVFTLNEAGQALQEDLENASKPRASKGQTKVVTLPLEIPAEE